jgi:hypothetical protein
MTVPGTQTPDLPLATRLTEVMGHINDNGVRRTRRQSVDTLLLQLLGSSGSMAAGWLGYHTRDELDADLAPDARRLAIVTNDPVAGNNGVFRKVGGSGEGPWLQILAMVPGTQIIEATDNGTGTPSAIVAEVNLPVSPWGGQIVSLITLQATTTSPVTVTLGGVGPLTVKTSSGADVPPDGMPAGSWMGRVMGGTFRLLSDFASAANLAAAAAEANRAETARGLAEHARDVAIGIVGDIAAEKEVPVFDNCASAALFHLVNYRQVTINRRTASSRLAPAPYEKVAQPANLEPSTSAKFQSADGFWFVLDTDSPTPEMFDADGGGIADDAVPMADADDYAAARGVELVCERTYNLTTNPDLLQARRRGCGLLKWSARTAPAAPRQLVKNRLWAGHFAISQKGSSFVTGPIRVQMVDGMTGARTDGSGGFTMHQDIGVRVPYGGRFTRQVGDAFTSKAIYCWTLTPTETKPYQDDRAFFQFYSRRGPGFSAPGGLAKMLMLGHRSTIQPITRLDGRYDLGTEVLASYTWAPGPELEPWEMPHVCEFGVPKYIQQMALVLELSCSSIAITGDYLDLEALHSDVGSPSRMPEASREELMAQAQTRLRKSGPYGAAFNHPSLAGAPSGLATATTGLRGVNIEVSWLTPMAGVPTLQWASPLADPGDGGVGRMGDETAGNRIWGRGLDVSPTGFRLVNADPAVVGNIMRAGYQAEVMI